MIYCVYSKATGAIRARFDTTESDAKRQLLDGEDIYIGDADCRAHRIDPETGARIDVGSEGVPADSIWIKSEQRWISADDLRRADARARMVELAAKSERAQREHLLGIVPTDEDRRSGAMTLAEIEEEMVALRSVLRTRGQG